MSEYLDVSRMDLPKLKITAFAGEERNKKSGSLEVLYDPESLKVERLNEHKKYTSVSGGEVTFDSWQKPSVLKVTLVLDDTTYGTPFVALPLFLAPKNGELPGSVDNMIKQLSQLCDVRDDKGNQPFLTIQSSAVPFLSTPSGSFHGRLISMNITSQLIDSLGGRVKARVDCEFGYSSKSKDKGGPELTKSLAMTAGATIASVGAATLGAAAIASLATSNSLDSLREDKTGDEITIPGS